MKKWMKGLAVGFLALALAACGNEAQEPAETKPGADEAKKSELTLEEVFNKAQEVSENTKSMHADMDMKQKISAPELGGEMETSMTMEMDMIQDPLAMHQLMTIEIPEMGTMETEIYMTEAGAFMKNPEGEEWMKLPLENFDEIMESMNASADASIDFEGLAEFVKDFTFEQDDDSYVLKLEASGDQFLKLIEEQLDAAGLAEGFGADELNALENMTVHELEYEIFVDKETFQTTSFNLIMDIEMNLEGESVLRMKQEVEAELSQINEIKEITIPQEVIDNAVE